MKTMDCKNCGRKIKKWHSYWIHVFNGGRFCKDGQNVAEIE